jgi:hypothetical protein
MDTYKIVRFFQNSKRTIDTSLSLDQAQAHCNDPETSSTTCTNQAGLARTRKHGDWFDGYYAE